MQSVCVFCGASGGNKALYRDAAAQFGRHLAAEGLELVWGGGHVGLMGVVAEAVLEAGGKVWGAIPGFMVERELAFAAPEAYREHSTIVIVEDMHSRKAAMADRADTFVALPGGFGTLDELFEIITWAQLSLHRKPIGLLNVEGFFDPLLEMVAHMSDEGFVRPAHAALLSHADTPQSLFAMLRAADA